MSNAPATKDTKAEAAKSVNDKKEAKEEKAPERTEEEKFFDKKAEIANAKYEIPDSQRI